MERGTDREHEAVRDQWNAMRERRTAANRLLVGFVAVFAGSLLLLLAGAGETCGFTIRGATEECTAVIQQPAVVLVGLLGVLVFGFGLWLCWTVSRE